MDIDILQERIKNQDWPIIYIKKNTGNQENGKAAFSGIHMIKREQSFAITMGIKSESPRVSEGLRIIISQNVICCCFLQPGLVGWLFWA